MMHDTGCRLKEEIRSTKSEIRNKSKIQSTNVPNPCSKLVAYGLPLLEFWSFEFVWDLEFSA